MAKRGTTLKKQVKSKHSPKTKKRLVVKQEMLAAKAAGRRTKKK